MSKIRDMVYAHIDLDDPERGPKVSIFEDQHPKLGRISKHRFNVGKYEFNYITRPGRNREFVFLSIGIMGSPFYMESKEGTYTPWRIKPDSSGIFPIKTELTAEYIGNILNGRNEMQRMWL